VTGRRTLVCAYWLLPVVLSTIAGSVDIIGFLSLGGLFTAHITGNLALLAAHYVTGRFYKIGPLLSVPVFVAVLGATAMTFAGDDKTRSRRALLVLHMVLLAGFLVLGAGFGPFADADSGTAVLVGMVGVAAMAIQHAVVRLTLPGSPATAVFKTNITQLAVDLAVLARGKTVPATADPEELARALHRVGVIAPCIAGFLVGSAVGALLEMHLHLLALAFPVALSVLAVPLGDWWRDHRTLEPVGAAPAASSVIRVHATGTGK
jgi:uncharacterized membrane protein YoaK (UPF0700 family)